MATGAGGLRAVMAALIALAAAAAAAAPAAAADEPTLSVQVAASQYGQAMPSGFLGVSFEYKAAHLYTGRDPGHVNPVLVALLKAMTPGQVPVVRIGGDSSDQTWWPMRHVIPPGGVSYRLTKGWLRTTKAFASALGGKLILGINLAAGRPALAAAESRALLQGIGIARILALEIGNEPDLYHVFPWYRDRRDRVVFSRSAQWNFAAFTNDFARWRAAMPTAPLAGPTFSYTSWMAGLDGFLASQRRLAVVTFHRYPLQACQTDPTSATYASIPNLLADASSAGLAQSVAPYTQVAHAHGLPFRLDELGSASCSGKKGVSDTFASALWVLDTLFNMAAVGVDGVNFHALPGAAYEPFTFTQHGSNWSAFVHPLYYGALMFSQAFPPGAQLLSVTAPDGPVKAWATQAPDGHTRVVLVNKSPDTPVNVQLTLPGDATAPLSSETLNAPSLSATSGVTFAGQTFGSTTTTGTLPGTPTATPIPSNLGTYTVRLAGGECGDADPVVYTPVLCSSRCSSRASFPESPGTASSSSRDAARIASGDPK